MKMEDLKFPLFETTEEEKDALRKAKELITVDNFFLCCVLGDMGQYKLITEVDRSLGNWGVLPNKLYAMNTTCEFKFFRWYHTNPNSNVLARKVWIDKLLAYNG